MMLLSVDHWTRDKRGQGWVMEMEVRGVYELTEKLWFRVQEGVKGFWEAGGTVEWEKGLSSFSPPALSLQHQHHPCLLASCPRRKLLVSLFKALEVVSTQNTKRAEEFGPLWGEGKMGWAAQQDGNDSFWDFGARPIELEGTSTTHLLGNL